MARGFMDRVRAAFHTERSDGIPARESSEPRRAQRAYSGAASGRLTHGWNASSWGPNSEVGGTGTKLRDRSSDLVRNNPHAKKAISVLVGDLVGTGSLPTPATGDAGVNAKLAAAWTQFAKTSNPASRVGIHGQVAQVVRGAAERGNAFMIRRWRRPGEYAIPMQIQCLEADFLDTAQDNTLGRSSGPRIVQGVEFDGIGRKSGYWFYPEHPGESASYAAWGNAKRVDAVNVIHVHEEIGERIGQVLGTPWLHAIVRALREIGEFDSATMVRQKFAAAPIGVVTGGDPESGTFGPQINSDTGEIITDGCVSNSQGEIVERSEPGMFYYAVDGRSFEFSQPPMPTGIKEYHSEVLHVAAAGAGLTYEALSGDLKGLSWTSYRAGRLPYNRWIRVGQMLWLIPCVYQPIYDWFVDACVLADVVTPQEVAALGADLNSAKWTPPRIESVDPAKDAAGDLIEVLAGFASKTENIAKRGRNPVELDNEITEERARANDLGIVFNSDAAATLAGVIASNNEDEQPAGSSAGDRSLGVV